MNETVKKAVLGDMLAVRKADLSPADRSRFKAELTVQARAFRGHSKVELFVENGEWVWLPRVWGFRFLKRLGFVVKDARTSGPDLNLTVDWALLDQPPYPSDQSTLVKTVVAKAKANCFGGWAIAPTGSGKTLMMSYAGALLGGPVLILVHKTDLIKNWIRSITEHVHLNGKTPAIGFIRGAKCQYGPQYPFVIGMFQSLALHKYPADFYSAFRTVVIDEAHHTPCATFLSVIYKLKAKYLLGTTATMRRKDGTEKAFACALGDVLYTMQRKGAQGRVYMLSVPFLIERKRLMAGGRISPSKIGRAFETLAYRNDQILEELIKAFYEGRKNLVLSHTRQHLSVLFNQLPPIIQRRAGFYVGGRKPEELAAVTRKRILFGTVGMAQEGMDIPDLDMLTLATPLKDVEQAAGRILRQHEDKMKPVILDFVDQHSTLVRWAQERIAYYKREGFPVHPNFPM